MKPLTTVVIGASRGLGLEFAKSLAAERDSHVIATMRKPFSLGQSNIDVLALDQTDTASVERAGQKVSEADVLILNAAMGEHELLTQTSPDQLLRYLDTNVVGLQRVINAFLPALRARQTRKIIFISALAASITRQINNPWGLGGPYAISKAAGNMLCIQYHNELHKDGFTIVAIDPGWAATDMGNLGGPGGMPPQESVERIMRIVNGLRPEDSTKFYGIEGDILPF